MTNEELAVRIRAGEKQYLSELYQRTRKLLRTTLKNTAK